MDGVLHVTRPTGNGSAVRTQPLPQPSVDVAASSF